MVFPVQSAFAAGLLLTLAFSLNEPAPAPAQPNRGAGLQLACDHTDIGAVSASNADLRLASPCSATTPR
jgi:hypothetical protein